MLLSQSKGGNTMKFSVNEIKTALYLWAGEADAPCFRHSLGVLFLNQLSKVALTYQYQI